MACRTKLDRLALPDGGETTLDEGVRAVGAYAYEGVVRDTLLAVKVGGQTAALGRMGELLRARLDLPPPGPRLALTWVPAGARALRERGLDVPRVLAGAGARPLLRRVRDTPDQTTLDARERLRSPVGAFAAPEPVPPAVVLVDDIRTTGGTARAASAALQAAGAKRILVATFAVAGS